MEVRNVSKQTVRGISTRTNNTAEMSPHGKIPDLWQLFDARVPVDYQGGERVYGVYYNYESDHAGMFNVLAGFDGASLPSDITLEEITIPYGKYLVFVERGDMPQIAIDAWTKVWEHFTRDDCPHQRLYNIDFEYYANGNQIEVHIAIK